jgi:hypothetical protein
MEEDKASAQAAVVHKKKLAQKIPSVGAKNNNSRQMKPPLDLLACFE